MTMKNIMITSEEFAAAMKKTSIANSCPQIAVAVSGGGDSMALAVLMQEWVQARSGTMLALTVDHGLRTESSNEARAVQKLLRDRGIPHEILVWDGAKPTTHIQERAREARYDLLLQSCRA